MDKRRILAGDIRLRYRGNAPVFCITFVAAFFLGSPGMATTEQDAFLLATGHNPSPDGLQVTETRTPQKFPDPFSKPSFAQATTTTISLKFVRDCIYQLEKENRQGGDLVSTQLSEIDFSYATIIKQDVDHSTRATINRFTLSGKDPRQKLLCIISDTETRQAGKCISTVSNNISDESTTFASVLKAFERTKVACKTP